MKSNTLLSDAQVKALVRLKKERGAAKLARDIGCSRNSIYRWVADESRAVDPYRMEAIERETKVKRAS